MLIKLNTLSCLKISRNIEIGNKSFERMGKVQYLGTVLTNQISIQEETKS